jgi:hypothetical protein
MPWIKSPFDVPIPTQRTVFPTTGLGEFGTIKVDVASRMKLLVATGPVLNAGPLDAPVQPTRAKKAARARVFDKENMVRIEMS